VGLADRLRGRFGGLARANHPDGIRELQIGDPRFDDWEVVRDFVDLATARAWRQQLADHGLDAVITADWEPDLFGRADIALRVPPGSWNEAEELLGDYD
jgi:hypothetical protein